MYQYGPIDKETFKTATLTQLNAAEGITKEQLTLVHNHIDSIVEEIAATFHMQYMDNGSHVASKIVFDCMTTNEATPDPNSIDIELIGKLTGIIFHQLHHK